ncbi:hypothetical protein [Variovorax ginsengisoli]|uniref:Uncharacterized protein n=1 Tax=Variovorax ginsengisoli TaxID=363844 RepID=A0ABT8SBU7_9BURK|nr:hypothetical protein [Variovorax ginsengisoli]MDN8617225.1 hypothetical protein [Variovorax ginsengisoli]MDO1536395.1 hypothetical protein [Variovorax ginsengisoli]
MSPIVGIPAQLVVNHMKDQLIAKFYGDDKSTGIIKSLENAKLGSLTLGGIASLGAAAAFVTGAAIPAIAALTAVAYSGLAGGIVSKLAKDHQEGKFYQLRDGLAAGNIQPPVAPLPAARALLSKGLTADETDAARWMSNPYVSKANLAKAIARFSDDFKEQHGRVPQVNWLKVGIANGDKKLVDFEAYFANRHQVQDALSFIAGKGGVAEDITRRVVKEEVQINQAAKLERLNPDSLRSPRDATWFSYLKAKVTGLLSERSEIDAGVAEVRSMSAALRAAGGAQGPSDEGVKAAFATDASDWKSDAPSMLDRVATRHDRLREVAQPLRETASL